MRQQHRQAPSPQSIPGATTPALVGTDGLTARHPERAMVVCSVSGEGIQTLAISGSFPL